MKILLSFALIFVFVFNSFGSPLVFKVTKEIKGNEFVELATVDTAKFKQIRIAIDATADDEVQQNVLDKKTFRVVIYAVESGKEIFLQDQVNNYVQYRALIDTPPTQIKIKVKGDSVYTVHIWAQ